MNYSNLLVAEPSFWEGFSRIFDWGGFFSSYNYCLTPGQADAQAIRNDWLLIGQDLESAMNEFKIQAKTASNNGAEG